MSTDDEKRAGMEGDATLDPAAGEANSSIGLDITKDIENADEPSDDDMGAYDNKSKGMIAVVMLSFSVNKHAHS